MTDPRNLPQLRRTRPVKEHCCAICDATERIVHMSTTRWIRKRTVQAELTRLYEVYFDTAAELEMERAYINDLYCRTIKLPTPAKGKKIVAALLAPVDAPPITLNTEGL